MKVLFWAGCTFRYRFPELVREHLKLLKILNYEVKQLSMEGCCGDPLLLMGADDLFKENAIKTSNLLNKVSVNLIITECAGCYHAFKVYEELGLSLPRLRHLSQVIYESLGRLPTPSLRERVAYHDPCELGRICGVYEEPREALKAVAEFVELKASRSEAVCCGGGGGLWPLAPELSLTIAEARLERDVEPLGASKLATACPTCMLNLSIAVERRRAKLGKAVEIVDLASYILSKLEV